MQERGRGLAEQAEMVHNMGEQEVSNMGQGNVHKQWNDCQMFTFSKLGVRQSKKMLLTLQNSLVGGGSLVLTIPNVCERASV